MKKIDILIEQKNGKYYATAQFNFKKFEESSNLEEEAIQKMKTFINKASKTNIEFTLKYHRSLLREKLFRYEVNY